jgi:hypothetical protein
MVNEYEVLLHHMKGFLQEKLSGDEIIKEIDAIVSNDFVYSLPENLCQKILNLQDEVAFYNFNPETRKGHEDLIGDEQLIILIQKFLLITNSV